jgi:hypothetical protein
MITLFSSTSYTAADYKWLRVVLQTGLTHCTCSEIPDCDACEHKMRVETWRGSMLSSPTKSILAQTATAIVIPSSRNANIVKNLTLDSLSVRMV